MKKYNLISICLTGYFTLSAICGFAAVDRTESPVSSEESRQKALQIFTGLDESGKYSDMLSLPSALSEEIELPIGQDRTINNVVYALAISNVKFEHEYAELTVWGRVIIPQNEKLNESGRTLFFGGEGIKLSYDGNIIGDAFLTLLGDVTIPINNGAASLTLKGDFDMGTGRGNRSTYMSIDCSGFKELAISAEIAFSDQLLKPVNMATGDTIHGKVSAQIQTVVRDWNDILVDLSLPPFAICGLTGFIFEAQHVVFDFSDYHNAPSIVFPGHYEEKYMIPGNPDLWRGVYISALNVILPKQFSNRKNKGKRISFPGRNLIFDQNGVSGKFTAENILSLENGSAGSWAFSVDRFMIELEANQLSGAGFGGSIGLPVARNTQLAYDAFISPDNEYVMTVATKDTLAFDIWAARATLENSWVRLKVIGDKFLPEAMLSGSLNIAAGLKPSEDGLNEKAVVQFNGIKFREMHLQTEAPYFSVKQLGYEGTFSLMNFPLSISKIECISTGQEVWLGFNAQVVLGISPFAMQAATRLEIVGSYAEEDGRQRWKYKNTKVSEIKINAEVAQVFSINGELTILNDDPVYGDGFAGQVALEIKKALPGVRAEVRAIFGHKDFHYWLVDGSVSFGGSGILVFPPALKLSGFGGGAYYRMKRESGGGEGMPTGSVYSPDGERGLGLKAAILFNIGSKTAINGEASFEMAFNKTGGIAFIGIYGQAQILASIPGTENIEKFVSDKFGQIAQKEKEFLKSNPMETLQKLKLYDSNQAARDLFVGSGKLGQSGFAAAVGIQYDFNENSLHATFDLYVNVLGGMLKGTASGNRAGWSVLHIEPGEWYIHLGTPTDRLGLKFSLGGLITAETGAYLMTGSQIPGSPPPPRQVADILGLELDKLDYMRELNSLGNGRGFAFGTNFSIATGDITFLIIYANFQAGLGFDIMMKDYGDAQCNGHRGPVGINGWFANGQAYVYLQGELGIKIKLFFIRKKIPIIKAGAATLMQAKLPNPAWFAGYLGVKFDLLAGLIKGNIRLKITFGEECELVIPGGSPLGVNVISDLSPADATSQVDVFTAPQVAFTMPVGKSFEMDDDDGTKRFRLTLDEFSLLDNGTPLEGKLQWNANRDVVSLYTNDILPGKVKLKVLVRVGFEEMQKGQWATVYTGGKKAEERMEIAFETGEAPDVIPVSNVEYCYPVCEQHFFLPGELARGYIQLKRGQSYLFSPDLKHEIHFVETGGGMQRLAFNYNKGNNRIEYTIPGFTSGGKYSFNLLTLSKEGGNADNGQELVAVGDSDNDITLRKTKAGQVIQSDAGKSLFTYNFGVSRYRTLQEKVSQMPLNRHSVWFSGGEILLGYRLLNAEPFDLVDLTGNGFSGGKPLVAIAAVLDDPYYTQKLYPLIYRNYPLPGGITLRNREGSLLGVPPVRAIPIWPEYLTQLENGELNGYVQLNFPYFYNLPAYYKRDYYDLREQVVNRYLGTKLAGEYSDLMNGLFPAFDDGSYRARLEYRLPDGTRGTSVRFEFKNEARDAE